MVGSRADFAGGAGGVDPRSEACWSGCRTAGTGLRCSRCSCWRPSCSACGTITTRCARSRERLSRRSARRLQCGDRNLHCARRAVGTALSGLRPRQALAPAARMRTPPRAHARHCRGQYEWGLNVMVGIRKTWSEVENVTRAAGGSTTRSAAVGAANACACRNCADRGQSCKHRLAPPAVRGQSDNHRSRRRRDHRSAVQSMVTALTP